MPLEPSWQRPHTTRAPTCAVQNSEGSKRIKAPGLSRVGSLGLPASTARLGKFIGVRIQPRLYDIISLLAKQQGRQFSDMARLLLLMGVTHHVRCLTKPNLLNKGEVRDEKT